MFAGLRSRWTTPCSCAWWMRPRHLHHDAERLAPVHRALGDAVGERPPLQVLEDDEELSARRVLADVVADDDARMREPGRDPRLGEEALLELVAGLSPAANASSMVLTATVRPSTVSSASYTTPIVPRPSSRRMM